MDDRQWDGLTVVEWPERMGDVLPAGRVDVRIAGTGDEPRAIDVEAGTPGLARYVDAARESGRG